MINLRQGDCLELMKDIPDKSIDMILCDLPYGVTQNKKDKIISFELLGSGSSGVACKNLNRNFIGIELDEKYFNIAKERISSIRDEDI